MNMAKVNAMIVQLDSTPPRREKTNANCAKLANTRIKKANINALIVQLDSTPPTREKTNANCAKLANTRIKKATINALIATTNRTRIESFFGWHKCPL